MRFHTTWKYFNDCFCTKGNLCTYSKKFLWYSLINCLRNVIKDGFGTNWTLSLTPTPQNLLIRWHLHILIYYEIVLSLVDAGHPTKCLGPWKVIPSGNGFCEFEFASLEDMHRVLEVNWLLEFESCGFKSFCLDIKILLKLTKAQCEDIWSTFFLLLGKLVFSQL